MLRFVVLLASLVCALPAASPENGSHVVQGDMLTPSAAAATALWPTQQIPYVIDAAVANPKRVQDALREWNTKTVVQFVPWVDQLARVRITTGSACAAAVGYSAETVVQLADSCATGEIIHLLGHAIGLTHVQQRPDRDQYVKFLPANTDRRTFDANAAVLPAPAAAVAYDYASIMHLSSTALSLDGILPWMVTSPAGIPIGQRTALSPGDIDLVARLYGAAPTTTVIATNPPGLTVTVDGVSGVAPLSFTWDAGTQHTVSVATTQSSGATRYQFARWSDAGTSAHTITASSATTVFTANYSRQFKVTAGAGVLGGGAVALSPASPDGYYSDTTVVTATATPATNFAFQQWGTGLATSNGLSANPLQFVVNAAGASAQASFTTAALTRLVSNPPGLPVTVDGASVTLPRSFAWTAGALHRIICAAQLASPGGARQYVYQSWSDGGAASRTLIGSAGGTFTVKYTPYYPLTLEVNQAWGTVTATPASSTGFYASGTKVQLTATTRPGFLFAGWAGDGSGSANPLAITMSDERVVMANFSAGPAPAITRIRSGAGNASTVFAPEEVITIEGTRLALSTASAPAGDAIALAGTSITVTDSNGTAAPATLYSASPTLLRAVLPAGLAPGTAALTVKSADGGSTAVTLELDTAAPGLFSADGTGFGAAAATFYFPAADEDDTTTVQPAYQCDRTGRCTSQPLDLGHARDSVLLALSGTGLRNAGAYGTVAATIGGAPVAIVSISPDNSLPGVDRVVLSVPAALYTSTENDVAVTTISPAASLVSNAVTVNLGGSTTAPLNAPRGLTLDSTGALYFAEAGANVVGKWSRGVFSIAAGTGDSGFDGDGNPAAASQFTAPSSVLVDAAGDLLVSDTGNARVRLLPPNGVFRTLAGNGTVATPVETVFDSLGNFYIADTGMKAVLLLTPDGNVAPFAGTDTANLTPNGLAFDAAGNLYVVDAAANQVRVIDPSGAISPFAGAGTKGFAGDGGLATPARLSAPSRVVVDASGNVFISDTGNHRVRRVTPAGIISTVAGNGTAGSTGDGGSALSAQLNRPVGLALDAAGNLYIAEEGGNRVRKVTPSGVITTVVSAQ